MRSTINKTEQFLQRVRWKVHFFENPNDKIEKETYGFKTKRNAPQSKSLINFEHDLTHLISNLEYSNKKTAFQKQLERDVKDINNSNKVYVSADKTNNVYLVEKNDYEKLMRDSITAHYEKTNESIENKINQEASEITEKLEISDRVEPMAHKSPYITLKDHKENFPNNIKTRLINPAKSNVGKISQQILQKINSDIRNKLELQQWRSTSDALNWFKNLDNKTRLSFIQFDIVDFYPSITETLFTEALKFASNITPIDDDTKNILLNARQSLLFYGNKVWKKTTGLFDVTMGSYDGCEVCELIGLFILQSIKNKFPEINAGLYRDDGLGTLKRTPKNKLERLKKDLHKMFKEDFGLSITLDTNLTIVNFLDVTLDLHNEKFYPYRKPNDTPTYIHIHSNHPSHVAKQLPIGINKRLNDITCDKTSFDTFKGDYEQALHKSGHHVTLEHNPTPENAETEHKRQRKRNIIWFTPPYSASLKTNLGKEFLKLIDKNFPANNPLHKILNRKTVKLSYSCTPNMKTIIAGHNKKVLATKEPTATKRCNCQNKPTCPVPGECCTSKVIYHASVQHEDGKKAEYIGSTETEFKFRFNNHKKSFKHDNYKSETTLSKYVWDHGLNPAPNITWSFLRQCSTYKVGSSSCDLCISEKL
ncbi:MAG: hypothetical protein GY694_20755, partial [Gammaproteobacteria bacterium]|nr:hypothetical protein [Gammaproteobacteria bacterium]